MDYGNPYASLPQVQTPAARAAADAVIKKKIAPALDDKDAKQIIYMEETAQTNTMPYANAVLLRNEGVDQNGAPRMPYVVRPRMEKGAHVVMRFTAQSSVKVPYVNGDDGTKPVPFSFKIPRKAIAEFLNLTDDDGFIIHDLVIDSMSGVQSCHTEFNCFLVEKDGFTTRLNPVPSWAYTTKEGETKHCDFLMGLHFDHNPKESLMKNATVTADTSTLQNYMGITLDMLTRDVVPIYEKVGSSSKNWSYTNVSSDEKKIMYYKVPVTMSARSVDAVCQAHPLAFMLERNIINVNADSGKAVPPDQRKVDYLDSKSLRVVPSIYNRMLSSLTDTITQCTRTILSKDGYLEIVCTPVPDMPVTINLLSDRKTIMAAPPHLITVEFSLNLYKYTLVDEPVPQWDIRRVYDGVPNPAIHLSQLFKAYNIPESVPSTAAMGGPVAGPQPVYGSVPAWNQTYA